MELISGELALKPLLTRIVESATELIGAQYGSIGLVEQHQQGPIIRIAAIVNMPPHELGMAVPINVGLAGRVLITQQPIVLDRYGEIEQPTLPELANHTVIGMPIWWGHQMIGFFGIGAEPPHHFSDLDVQTLSLFARHAAIAIHNAHLYQQECQRNERLKLIAHIGRMVSSDLRLDELLQNAADVIHTLFNHHTITISILHPGDPPQLILQAASGYQPTPIKAGYAITATKGITGAALQSRKVQLVNDVTNDRRYIPIPGLAPIQAELAVPILHGEEALGVLNIESNILFTEEDAASLVIIADQLATAIDNARLFEAEQQRVRRMATINRIGNLLTSSLDFYQLFQKAVEAIHMDFGFAYVAAGIVEPNNPEMLMLLAHKGIHEEKVPPGYRQSIYEGLVGTTARTRQRVLVNNVANDPRYKALLEAPSLCAELTVPLLAGDQLLGVLNIEHDQPISIEEIEAIDIIADQFGAALSNARLFDNVQRSLDRTRLLYETSRRISTAMSVQDVITAYLEHVAAGDRYACAIVLLATNQTGQRTHMIVQGRWSADNGTSLAVERWPFIHAPFTPLLDIGQTITIDNVYTDRQVPSALRDMQTANGDTALALIPLMVRGERIGMVMLSDTIAHHWLEEELYPYQVTAAQLASTIDSRQQQVLAGKQSEQLAVLEERQRLARELHDSVTQSLFGMSLLAQALPELWEIDRDEAHQSLRQIQQLTRESLAEMRALLFELRPADVEKQNLAFMLKKHMTAFEQRTGLIVTSAITEDTALPETVIHAFSRIAQEALNNIARHANARRVWLSLSMKGWTTLKIQDDGQGFVPEQVGVGHLGLISIRERAAAINARLKIASVVGEGTTIVVEWKCPELYI
ncbi:MAG: GAF domain-containing sensor histidine kinase [Chloroflexota bacterium]